MDKYWSDFSGQIYHYSETSKVDHLNVVNINSNFQKNEANWSEGLLFALDQVKSDFVILMLEDFFLSQKVVNAKVEEHFNFMKLHPEIKCLRLVPIPGPDKVETDDLGKISKGQPYRISTQMAIWDKNYLYSLVNKNESPWQFEHNGTARSNNMDGEVWAVRSKPHKERIMTHVNGIIRGKLTKQAVNFLGDEKIKIPQEIPVNSKIEDYYWFSASTNIRKLMDFTNTRIYPFMWKNKL